VVMTGCYVDGHRDAVESDGRTYVVGNSQKARIPQLVDAHFRGELLPGHLEKDRDPFGYPVAERVFRTRAMVKVQDGCDNYCTFCIIPFVRGRAVSRSLRETVKAVGDAAASGYREIVLTGVNMSRWEEDGKGFAELLKATLEVEGDFRLRLGSVEPDRLSEELLELMSHPKMTSHLHLCLQSGSERILLAMRRQYTAAEFESFASALRTRIPGFNITTDVIVGFPGEAEEDFAETLDVCRRVGFGHIHTFPYSRRDGTRADRMDNHVKDVEKKRRGEEVRQLSEQMKRAFRESLVGSEHEVLVERAEAEADGSITARGLSSSYVPVRFSLPGTRSPEEVQNEIFTVLIENVDVGEDPDLLGAVNPVL
ncbi:MAG: MiaB/RimO family radical SAM methylthiotransferase, partial [Spirochaetaceae bacterium]|nr:MiaB/RimO family radical SAM methylthiotransferase [Spirochaetaceae bacterium]